MLASASASGRFSCACAPKCAKHVRGGGDLLVKRPIPLSPTLITTQDSPHSAPVGQDGAAPGLMCGKYARRVLMRAYLCIALAAWILVTDMAIASLCMACYTWFNSNLKMGENRRFDYATAANSS
ncbi:hypothetical protein BDW02DRAFT_380681 [Decorospora gaudefroyi]|uniref:Uncharacterized protein n=1 Tax=Decorospora gaudefroyi TaxID=184978 RepID=A0A6A5KEB2_9PLEO|nr:hypothetical protein BDW02DRAFT_380681 [Decorospora gaudefroyi]